MWFFHVGLRVRRRTLVAGSTFPVRSQWSRFGGSEQNFTYGSEVPATSMALQPRARSPVTQISGQRAGLNRGV